MMWKVPFADLRLGDEEKAAVLAVLESNWLTMGPKTAEFEAAFAAALACPDLGAVAVSNCTAGLHLALAALGIGPGDEVIVPSLTFVATANAARYVGAIPVFADIVSPDDWNIDPDDIARKITPRTRAIIPVHYAGYPCRMDRIMELAEKHGLKVVEDASHAPLSQWNAKMLGTIGHVGCFSFFGNKNMTTGEGGMVVSADADLVQTIRTMRSHGMTSNTYARFRGHAFGYDVVSLGWNYRMDEMRAAMGLVQLSKLASSNRRRGELVAYYRKRLGETLPQVRVPFREVQGELAWHIFPVLLPEGTDREAVMQGLKDQGIQTSIHYRPIHWMTDFGSGETVRLDKLDRLALQILTLPLFPTLAEEQIDRVAATLEACLA
ncbi:DegT/DnrJ/EryC1/StrS family aminotransferase [Magnetospirillum gryphiswaldense]|uniref:DegT/DnrJ/EryC1/StrS aminotransferase n=1 Tax=Magnetospirillum gryphiswaldense TaxID=55518 RepID=A4U175_9PROT|nr:DegT/DnrJ/EryC1/StrS aminotransferase family protein [Magnetospirillum gryphiswaldense]AVM75587.1 UDP-4-amino-4-deoxy-L-arabinose--oxoglutarate aminotransferase [Magnetospirillum gryphiswaldense MSR-1]AVM79490.1 UDP-4-amino-4-deoxy-L-arabinose--oxoglutarate aminotransferase [Magnetospirillum gryphiswaldense]CAM76632.1 DegT/DnrJ/EryC1/StrS aminotransferase [Magnetospirillum gryphiswaldense MSR-1]